MSIFSDIKCNLCEYQFETISKTKSEYLDVDSGYIDVVYYYPNSQENAHKLNGHYICDNCYKSIGDKVRNILIKTGEDYTNSLNKRKEDEYTKYLEIINKLEEKASSVITVIEKLKSISEIYGLSGDEITYIKNYFPHTKTYYLEDAIRIEKENKLGVRRISDWLKMYNLTINSLPKGVSYSGMVDKKEFKSLLMDSQITNMTQREIFNLIQDL